MSNTKEVTKLSYKYTNGTECSITFGLIILEMTFLNTNLLQFCNMQRTKCNTFTEF